MNNFPLKTVVRVGPTLTKLSGKGLDGGLAFSFLFSTGCLSSEKGNISQAIFACHFVRSLQVYLGIVKVSLFIFSGFVWGFAL